MTLDYLQFAAAKCLNQDYVNDKFEHIITRVTVKDSFHFPRLLFTSRDNYYCSRQDQWLRALLSYYSVIVIKNIYTHIIILLADVDLFKPLDIFYDKNNFIILQVNHFMIFILYNFL